MAQIASSNAIDSVSRFVAPGAFVLAAADNIISVCCSMCTFVIIAVLKLVLS